MALVPNGKIRLMEKQSFNNVLAQVQFPDDVEQTSSGNAPAQSGAQDLQPRMEVEQQQLAGESGASQDAEVQQNPEIAKVPQSMVQPEEEQQQVQEDDASDLKGFIYKLLESQGVQRRQLEGVDKQIYSEKTDLQSNTISGHYMIPTFTSNGEIDKKKAIALAKQIGDKFGLDQHMNLNGRNWKVDFSTKQQADLQQGGSSFDELHSGQGQKKAAATITEMMLERRSELYETMRKLAGGRR